jgi:hypothetical protein
MARGKDMQQGHPAWISAMDLDHVHIIGIISRDMQQGYAA